MYDIEKIRADFPILAREVNGKPLVYLDNGASAQKPQVVIDAVTHAYTHEYANVHRGLHTLSNIATEKYEAVRGTIANDLRDRRELALRELGEHIDISVRENVQGAVQVQVDGQLLVGAQSVRELRVETDSDGAITLRVEGGVQPVVARGGQLAGIIEFAGRFANDVADGLDQYARAIVLETNRAHTTGVPLDGGFTQLRATNAVRDLDGDGDLTDALLRDVGLPFDIGTGELYVHVVDDATGSFTTDLIEVDPARMTVGGFIDALSNVGGLPARIANSGRVTVDASSGQKFHFGRPLDTDPDDHGTFGGGRASTVGASGEPCTTLTPTSFIDEVWMSAPSRASRTKSVLISSGLAGRPSESTPVAMS